METSNLFGPWLMDIFVSLGISQVDIIVSLKMACSWSTTTFYIISAFFLPKIDERKNWIFWRKLWINPFCKNRIFWRFEKWTFLLVLKGLFLIYNNISHNFQLFSPKIEKIEFFLSKWWVNPDRLGRLLAIVQKDIFLCRTKFNV